MTEPFLLEHEGYIGRVAYDANDQIFHGRIVSIRDLVTFQGRSEAELRTAFAESLADYRAMCVERGEEPEEPRSGTDWARLGTRTDEEIEEGARRDPDNPPASDEWLRNARLVMPEEREAPE